MNKSIYERQNDEFILKCLALQGIKYSEAKRFLGYKDCLTFLYVIFSVAGTAYNNNNFTAFVNLFSLGLMFISRICDESGMKRALYAAEVQKFIDISLFSLADDLNWGSLGRLLPKQSLEKQFEKYEPLNVNHFRDWYNFNACHSLEEQIYYCQRENVKTDSRVKIHYLTFIGLFSLTIFFITMTFLLLKSETINVINVIYCLIWCVPIISYIYTLRKGYLDSIHCIALSEKICQDIEIYINNGSLSRHKDLLVDLQETIQDNRKILSFVPDWFFKIDSAIFG